MQETKDILIAENVTSTHVYFWNGVYSQWYYQPELIKELNITLNGSFIYYSSAEKYMMMKKALLFKDFKIYSQIKDNENACLIKALGRQIQNFDDDIWNKHKIDIVTHGNYLKFTQNPYLLEILLEHRDKTIVEASPEDCIWGIGLHPNDPRVYNESNWQGQNLLGLCIMQARDKIINDLNDLNETKEINEEL